MIAKAFRKWIQTFRELFRFSSPLKTGFFILFFGIVPFCFFLSGYLDTSLPEKKLTDAKIAFLAQATEIDPRLVILEIDAESLSEIKSQWPWPRAIYAEVLNTLRDSNPAGIIFTILFQQLENKRDGFPKLSPGAPPGEGALKTSPSGRKLPTSPSVENGSSGDQNLIDAMKAMGNVFLPQLIQESFFGAVSQINLLSPHESFCSASSGLGFSKILLDEDNIARLVVFLLQGSTARSLISCGLSALKFDLQVNKEGLFDGKNVMVIYAGKGKIPKIPISFLVDRSWKNDSSFSWRSPPKKAELLEQFRGKLVFIGVTAPILHDQFFTPGGFLSGVEIMANGVNTFLQKVQIRNFNGFGIRFLFLILVSLGALVFITNPEQSHGSRLGFLLAGFFTILCLDFFSFRFLQYQTPCIYLMLYSGYIFLIQTICLGFTERLEKETLEKELEIGRKMQTSLLPETIPQIHGVEIFAESRPAREIGGDLFDFIQFPDGRLGLLIGDVAGKGVQAGLFMGMAGFMLKHKGSQTPSPAKALIQTSQAFRDHFAGIAPTYLTACFAIFDPLTMELSVANAGHEPPVCVIPTPTMGEVGRRRQDGAFQADPTPTMGEVGRRRQDGEVFKDPPAKKAEQIPLYGPPLGPVWLLDQIEYSTWTIPVVDGLQVIFFSDGFTEAFNVAGETFGKERFLEAIGKNADYSPEKLGRSLFSMIDEHEKDIAPSDDKTLMIIKFSEKARQLPALIDESLDQKFASLWTNPEGDWKRHEFKADINLLNGLSDQIIEGLATKRFSSADQFAVELLLEEAFSNAWKHGCKKDAQKQICVLVHISPDFFETFVKDEGAGFILQKKSPLGQKKEDEDEDKYRDSGRGLDLLRQYSNRVAYNPAGNILYFKRLRSRDE